MSEMIQMKILKWIHHENDGSFKNIKAIWKQVIPISLHILGPEGGGLRWRSRVLKDSHHSKVSSSLPFFSSCYLKEILLVSLFLFD
jgi:hypothetical protein